METELPFPWKTFYKSFSHRSRSPLWNCMVEANPGVIIVLQRNGSK